MARPDFYSDSEPIKVPIENGDTSWIPVRLQIQSYPDDKVKTITLTQDYLVEVKNSESFDNAVYHLSRYISKEGSN